MFLSWLRKKKSPQAELIASPSPRVGMQQRHSDGHVFILAARVGLQTAAVADGFSCDQRNAGKFPGLCQGVAMHVKGRSFQGLMAVTLLDV